MGAYADHTSEYLWGDAVSGWSIDRRLEPRLVPRMIFGIRTKRVNQYVDVTEDQSWPSNRSRRLALSFRSTPALMPPPAWHSGSDTAARSDRFNGLRRTSCNPCSIRDVSVTPRRSASCRARSRSFSSNLTVVLICQSIPLVCLYVKDTGSVHLVFKRPAYRLSPSRDVFRLPPEHAAQDFGKLRIASRSPWQPILILPTQDPNWQRTYTVKPHATKTFSYRTAGGQVFSFAIQHGPEMPEGQVGLEFGWAKQRLFCTGKNCAQASGWLLFCPVRGSISGELTNLSDSDFQVIVRRIQCEGTDAGTMRCPTTSMLRAMCGGT